MPIWLEMEGIGLSKVLGILKFHWSYYVHYSDVFMETLCIKLRLLMRQLSQVMCYKLPWGGQSVKKLRIYVWTTTILYMGVTFFFFFFFFSIAIIM